MIFLVSMMKIMPILKCKRNISTNNYTIYQKMPVTNITVLAFTDFGDNLFVLTFVSAGIFQARSIHSEGGELTPCRFCDVTGTKT